MPPFQKWAVRGMKAGEAGTAASLIAAAFAQEAAGLGLGENQWAALLAAELDATHPSLIAVAVRDSSISSDELVGVVVLRTAGGEGEQPKGRRRWWWERAPHGGLSAAARLALRDWVLPEAVARHEVLIEYLCVSPAARRQGVAIALLVAAERAAERAAGEGAPGRKLSLWVAASNAAAVALYAQASFTATKRTAEGGWLTQAACAFFLGEAAWVRMEKGVGMAEAKRAALPPASPPASPRLASYRPGEGATVVAAL